MKAGSPALSTRKKILAAAIGLFSRRGFYAVPVREIARKAGIKASSLYNHFKSKDEILSEILNMFQAAVDEFSVKHLSPESLDSILRSGSPEESLTAVLDHFIQFWEPRRREKLWFIVSMEQYRNPRAGQLILRMTRTNLEFSESFFDGLIKRGRIKSGDPGQMAAAFAYAVRAMHIEYRLLKAARRDTAEIRGRMIDYIRFLLGHA